MAYQVNPMQLIQMIKSGQNPQQLMLGILEKQAQGNPMYQNIMLLAKQNRTKEIEDIARNFSKERGIDFDKEFKIFRQNLGF